jgi:hypothetical protein
MVNLAALKNDPASDKSPEGISRVVGINGKVLMVLHAGMDISYAVYKILFDNFTMQV